MKGVKPVIFGEVLFDIFSADKKVLGGAPFNVAWNLKGFGFDPLFISRVGNDSLGSEIKDIASNWGLDTNGIQTDSTHPTGTVAITFDEISHTFDIKSDQAYDRIDGEKALVEVNNGNPEVLYFGTLAIRESCSHAALERLLTQNIPAFVDINLREPWWTIDLVNQALRHATWLKLNDDELLLIRKQLINSPENEDLQQSLHKLKDRFNLSQVILTCGEQGAYLLDDDGCFFQAPPTEVKIVDTIGAGDAFSSVVIAGLLLQWRSEVVLPRALEFAAAVCTLPGATCLEKEFYKGFSQSWLS